MKRYIDSEKAVEQARWAYCEGCNSMCQACQAEGVLNFIETFPTAENVAEVVFCQDCKYAQRVLDEYGNLDYKCRKMNDYMSPTDFCSRGERKEKLK